MTAVKISSILLITLIGLSMISTITAIPVGWFEAPESNLKDLLGKPIRIRVGRSAASTPFLTGRPGSNQAHVTTSQGDDAAWIITRVPKTKDYLIRNVATGLYLEGDSTDAHEHEVFVGERNKKDLNQEWKIFYHAGLNLYSLVNSAPTQALDSPGRYDGRPSVYLNDWFVENVYQQWTLSAL